MAKKPPHWVQDYYISKANPPVGGKYPDGFICSCCLKKSYSKKESCDGCGSVMVNSDKILSDLQKVADVVELSEVKKVIMDYIFDQTVSKYPSAELCRASRMGAEGVIYALEYAFEKKEESDGNL